MCGIMNLINYFCKNVRLIDIDNKEWRGYVKTFTPAIDSEFEIDEIGLFTGTDLIGFREDEIKAIETID